MNSIPLQIEPYPFDDEMLAASREDCTPQMRVYRMPGNFVILGRGSKPRVEVSLKTCLADKIPILQRYGGGCAVVLDPGNVIISLSMPVKGMGRYRERFRCISAWVIRGLQEAGIEGVYPEGISDLACDGRKVGGACIHHSRGLLYYSASLLVTPDLDKVALYLPHPPREPDYRRGRAHRDFMMTLAPGLWPGSAEDLACALRRSLNAGSAFESFHRKG